MGRLLRRLALDRPELRAWALYDWANSAMVTIVITAVFPIFYRRVAGAGLEEAQATARFSLATTIALLVIAVLAPVLGAIADRSGSKKRFLGIFLGLGVLATTAMFGISSGQWFFAAVLFVLANVGVMGSFVFYDSLLPHVARDEEVDRLSTTAYALGYLGGGLLLVAVLVVIQKPEWFGLPTGEGLTADQRALPSRIAFLMVGVWWLAFSIPLFRRVPEPRSSNGDVEPASVMQALRRLRDTARELKRYRQAFLLLLGFLIYNDGVNTIYRMATVFGDELGLKTSSMIAAIVLVQFVGIPCTLLLGWVAGRIGAKRVVMGGLVVYMGVCVLGYRLQSELGFFVLAGLVGLVQGGVQALSRSLFAAMIPKERSAEFFGVFAVLDRFGALMGPLIFFAVSSWTGSSRPAILFLIAFFVLGGAILARVDVDEGRRSAQV